MLRKLLSTLAVLALCVGVTLAAEIRGAFIFKVDSDQVTFAQYTTKEKGGGRGPSRTLAAANKVKVVRVKFNPDPKKREAGDPVMQGLQNEIFTKIGKKGVPCNIVTDADNKKITEIRVIIYEEK